MAGDFDAFNEQVETDPDTEKVPSRSEEPEDTGYDGQVSDVAVVGDNDDRLKITAESSEGGRVDRELDTEEAGRLMSQLDIEDVREFEGQPVLVWKDDDGTPHLEFDLEDLG
ncbi:hypothetical protein ACFQPA_03455 [Halomarina halobia]|uniref:Uncharacterized protein n=1 Tax=Halomarina halobia TaxID=3033386 RepID=A0ABD6A6A5_9EURY|nr:hypothetical protein [Halomarina sp. PSR21]